MFPLSYKHTTVVPLQSDQKFNRLELFTIFKEKFDNPRMQTPDTITFDNFNVFYKRHGWLGNGELKIYMKENRIYSDLTLYFYYTSILFFFMSCLLIAMNTDTILYALAGVAVFWIFYLLLYLWTATMFRLTIANTIKRQLFNQRFR